MHFFRPEAVEAKSRTGMGDVIITQPRIFWLMTTGALGIALAGIAFAILGEFTRKETVTGFLAPREGVAAVYAPRGGIIHQVAISQGDEVEAGTVTGFLAPREGVAAVYAPRGGIIHQVAISQGDEVEAGQLLVLLQTGQSNDLGQDEIAVQIGQVDTRLTEARLQLELAEQQYVAEFTRLEDRLSGLRVELSQIRTRHALAQESAVIARTQWERWQSLAERGLAPIGEVDRRRQSYLSAETAIADSTRQITEREGQIRETQHALDLIPTQSEIAVSRARSDIAALEQSRSELVRAGGYALTAPISGTVSFVEASPGVDAKPVRVILDEFAALEKLSLIETAFGTMAGLGVQLWVVTQDLTQLMRL
eukprot:Skav233285  [mRNA]  locus=scaffold7558:9369:13554:+ [translate_table: standard]